MNPSLSLTNSAQLSPSDSVVEEVFSVGDGYLYRSIRCGQFHGSSKVLLTQEQSEPLCDTWDRHVMKGGAIAFDIASGSLRIADFFCGGGGLSFGASQMARSLGLEPFVQLASDSDVSVNDLYEVNNHPRSHASVPFEELIGCKATASSDRAVELDSFSPQLSHLVDNIDLVLAGPPCQGFSNLNNSTRRDDDRNDLYAATVAASIELGAPLILIENLPEVRSDKRQALVKAQCLLHRADYHVDAQIVSALDCGVSQTRRRMFLAASKFGPVDIQGAVKALGRPHRDLRWAIGDLENASEGSDFDRPSDLSVENQRRISHLFETDEYNMPNEFRPDCHKDGHTYGAVYGRLSWNKPAQTITSGFMVPGRGRYIHPSRMRTLTPHEAARIQGFPDSFRFVDRAGRSVPRKTYSKVIGNAVPPPMGAAAVAALIATLPVNYRSDRY